MFRLIMSLLLLLCPLAFFVSAGSPAAAPVAPLLLAIAENDDNPTTPELDNKIDAATDKALAYLAKIQHRNGSWTRSPTRENGYEAAATSLAVMAFMAKGHLPGEEPYGQVLEKGIDYVLTKQLPNGYIAGSGQMYAHGISTLMLAEASGQVAGKREKQVKDALARAVKLILDAQKVKKSKNYAGGWRYQPTSVDSDLSLTGWQLMALRAAKNAGADVPSEAIEMAVDYVKRSAHAKGGFSYTPGSPPTHAMTGTGIVAMELCGKHHAKESLAAGDWLLAQAVRPFGGNHQYYTMYYCSQAMFQLGSHHFNQFWPRWSEEILKRQQPDGSFPLGAAAEASAGPAYGTSMAVLSLAVQYRLLPIYQR